VGLGTIAVGENMLTKNVPERDKSNPPPVSSAKYTLEQLLAGITPGNIHAEINMGDAVGNEFW
jgi:antitoxin component of MazEF toxin-antitoxin module